MNRLIEREVISGEEGNETIRTILRNFRRATTIIKRMQIREKEIIKLRKSLLENKVRYLDFEAGMSDLAFQYRIVNHKLV